MSDPITTHAIELAAAIELERMKLFDAVDRIERAQARSEAMLAELVALFKPKPEPAPEMPSLPPRSPDMLLYQPTWRDVTLHKPNDVGTGLLWVRALQTPAGETAQNSSLASADVVGDVLRLRIAPTFYPQQLAARVVLTNERTQWTALAPYAGKTLYGRMWLMFPELPAIDEAGGTAGRWLSAGFQIKDDPKISALYQWNVDERHEPFLTYRLKPVASAKNILPDYQAGKWTQLDFVWLMTAAENGYFNVSIDGTMAYAAAGRSAAASGFASFHLLLYGDSLRAPTELLISGVVISTAPIP